MLFRNKKEQTAERATWINLKNMNIKRKKPQATDHILYNSILWNIQKIPKTGLCIFTKNYWFVHSEWVNFITWKLNLNTLLRTKQSITVCQAVLVKYRLSLSSEDFHVRTKAWRDVQSRTTQEWQRPWSGEGRTPHCQRCLHLWMKYPVCHFTVTSHSALLFFFYPVRVFNTFTLCKSVELETVKILL